MSLSFVEIGQMSVKPICLDNTMLSTIVPMIHSLTKMLIIYKFILIYKVSIEKKLTFYVLK